ncbi:helix-turn-helix domain-containing protein [Actinoalloteichus hymeniacidonis]|uniref:DNA binding protein with helix-turn-helix domain n=1 Tax=Actinoalloteichus hymeniacidonis TaxID=340345 RepID=A0AAC9HQ77_9PSEU|nr:helix-turn-helix transcriptional regulator [Actinoalloteichus hymeniacidonis]AOS63311.1 DNA binding protein with helix-turn-helix domain [Actinoalloteichus hymeniacidonis]MBB5908650.1 transcriptional regulator with XRE-family HTH domain [Actinoalloteichus hymeniacidonis]
MQQNDGAVGGMVRRWQLAETLRNLREQSGLTHDQVLAELSGQGRWSRPKLSRIENREQGVKAREVEQLLNVYRVTESSLREWLLELANTPRERGWTVDVRKSLPEDFHRFLALESALVASRQFETLLIPGLLQTPEYARALISGIGPQLPEDEVERRVAARITRQQILARTNAPTLHAIVDAGALERPVSEPRVMRGQMRRLVEAAELPHVTVQVLPKSAGGGPAVEGPFSILTLQDPIPDIGYSEGPGRAVYIEDRDQVRDYTLRFGVLTEQALSQHESTALIDDLGRELE